MPAAITDQLWPVLEDIAAGLETRVNLGLAVDDDDYAMVAIHPGEEVIIEGCCPGFAWVRVVNFYPSNDFPNEVVSSREQRVGSRFAATLEIGITRCSAVAGDDGTIGIDELAADAETASRDITALTQFLVCDLRDVTGVSQWTMESVQPLSILGGCMGAAVLFTIPTEICCDPIPAP